VYLSVNVSRNILNPNSRISSIIKASNLDSSITGIDAFKLSILKDISDSNFQLPTNIRLGHLVERIVAQLIKSSSNYQVLHENTQIIEGKRTIGEIDFIIQNKKTKQITHLELAYKFYLFDPTISTEPIENWIGPNRNDSLKQKLEKLTSKQFPLLYGDCTKSLFADIKIEDVSQRLCLLASLFIPYECTTILSPTYKQAVKGYYLNFETFNNLDHSGKCFYIPSKKEWGIEPSENENWERLAEVENKIETSILERQSLLCWQKHLNEYSAFFIVWW